MRKEEKTIGGRECLLWGDPDARDVLIQPVDSHDLDGLDAQLSVMEDALGDSFLLAAFRVRDWNRELSPWEAPPVFGREGFGSGAEDTLGFILETLLPEIGGDAGDRRRCLGGYSLAALFSLWAAYRTDRFQGIAAASPSVWFPGWDAFIRQGPVRAEAVYLSLGDREARTRNPVMAAVADRIRLQHEVLSGDPGCGASTLEWNPGNHFKEPARRTARAFLWVLQTLRSRGETLGEP